MMKEVATATRQPKRSMRQVLADSTLGVAFTLAVLYFATDQKFGGPMLKVPAYAVLLVSVVRFEVHLREWRRATRKMKRSAQ